jgi:hypothetical protein
MLSRTKSLRKRVVLEFARSIPIRYRLVRLHIWNTRNAFVLHFDPTNNRAPAALCALLWPICGFVHHRVSSEAGRRA